MADETQNRINVISPEGEFQNIDASELKSAESYGYRVASKEELNHQELKEKYGTEAIDGVKAFLIEAVDTVPLAGGLALKAAGVTPEAKKAREEFWPVSTFLGGAAGFGAQLALPVGTAAKGLVAVESRIASELGKGAAKSIGGAALKGAIKYAPGSAVSAMLYETGQIANEEIIGEPQLSGQEIAARIGFQGLIGAGFGGLGGAAFGAAKHAMEGQSLKELAESGVVKAVKDESKAIDGAADTIVAEEQANNMLYDEARADLSIKEIKETMENLPEGVQKVTERPRKENLLQAREITKGRLKLPIQNAQIGAAADRQAEQEFKTLKLTKNGRIIEQLEATQKAEMVKAMDDISHEIAPGHTPNQSKNEAGEFLIGLFKTADKAAREEAIPLLETLDKVTSNIGSTNAEVLDIIKESVPALKPLMDVDDSGKFFLKAYTPRGGLNREAYDWAAKIIKDINDAPLTLRELENYRTLMLDDTAYGRPPSLQYQIGEIRKGLLDYIDSAVQSAHPEISAKEAYKKYAITEKNRTVLKKILGGDIREMFDSTRAPNPDKVLDKIFANPEHVKIAKSVLGEDFDKIVADYVKTEMVKAYNKETGEYISSKFARMLENKDSSLIIAFKEKPMLLQELDALNTQIKLLADAGPANPPNTAETSKLMAEIAGANSVFDAAKKAAKYAYNIGKENAEARKAERVFDALQKGKNIEEAKEAKNWVIKDYVTKKILEAKSLETRKAISSGINSIVSKTGVGQPSAIITDTLTREDRNKMYDKVSNQIRSIQAMPEDFVNDISKTTEHISENAPMITDSIQTTSLRAANFLMTKLPKEQETGVFGQKWEPSDGEKAEFLHYFRAVNNPIIALYDIKNGVLTKQTVEAISSVFPDLYNEMSVQLINRAINSKAHIPYQTKLMMSMFTNQPLDYSLQPKFILSNQQSLAAPSVQQNAMPQQGVKPTQKGLEKLGVADRILTPMQKSQQRRE